MTSSRCGNWKIKWKTLSEFLWENFESTDSVEIFRTCLDSQNQWYINYYTFNYPPQFIFTISLLVIYSLSPSLRGSWMSKTQRIQENLRVERKIWTFSQFSPSFVICGFSTQFSLFIRQFSILLTIITFAEFVLSQLLCVDTAGSTFCEIIVKISEKFC